MRGKIILGRYEVQRLLGEGGMGKVYLARQLDLDRQVVLKVMHDQFSADQQFREHFQREMLLMAKFQHPYAVTLFDAVVNATEGPCIIMEYVRGETVEELLKRNGHLSPFRVGRLPGQVCEVLQEAHGQGIIHRDLKPSNLMVLEADSPYEKIKVMDFGLARLVGPHPLRSNREGASEFLLGTPAYVCPEQARGEEVDHRGDLYSVGVILYELLTGRLPFQGLNTMDTLLAHAVDVPPPMRESDVWVPPSLEEVVMKCLQKLPENRPASARDLARLYEDALRAADESEAAEEQSPEEGDGSPPPLPDATDPNTAAYQVLAWMPEAVAAYKVKGFIQDVGGEVTESIPGRIRVLLGGRGSAYQLARAGWFGFASKPWIEMELQLHPGHNGEDSHIWVNVIIKNKSRNANPHWRAVADQVFRDLRGYLMGSTAVHAK